MQIYANAYVDAGRQKGAQVPVQRDLGDFTVATKAQSVRASVTGAKFF